MTAIQRAKLLVLYSIAGFFLALTIQTLTAPTTSIAQSPDVIATGIGYQHAGEWRVICDNGDLYGTHYGDPTWQYITNVFDEAGVVRGAPASLGSVKDAFR